MALIIEDEFAVRAVYEAILNRMGFDAIHAVDGEAALSLLEYYTPNLILLDMLLPKVDGSVVLEQLQAMPQLQQVPIVVITAHAEFQNQVDLGPNDRFLVKPIRPRELSEAAESLMTVP